MFSRECAIKDDIFYHLTLLLVLHYLANIFGFCCFVLYVTGPILSVFPALIVHSELKSVHPGFPVAFVFKHKLINK